MADASVTCANCFVCGQEVGTAHKCSRC